RSKACVPHGIHSISFARLGRGENLKSFIGIGIPAKKRSEIKKHYDRIDCERGYSRRLHSKRQGDPEEESKRQADRTITPVSAWYHSVDVRIVITAAC